jgi:demethylspheroidene O-methyltransferase
VDVSAGPLEPAFPRISFRTALRERWLAFRNGLIANAGFQRWAAGFPLTRAVAHHHERALFDLVAGFVYSQVLAACVRLQVFDALAEGPLSVGALAQRLSLPADATTRLMRAAVALDLAESLPHDRYALGRLGAALRGNPSLAAMIEHHAMLYADLADPVALLRGEQTASNLAAFWPYARNADPAISGDARVRDYSALMAGSQALIADQVLAAYPFHKHRRLLDIGGGEGVFLAAAGQRVPGLGLMLFDLPAVAQRAVSRLNTAALQGHAQIYAGDFLRDPLPVGADVASLVRVLHDHDDAPALAILRNARAALPVGGVLLIAEPMSGTPGAEPVGDAYFGFYLAAMGSGRPRTAAEISALVREAGFTRTRLVPTRSPLIVRLLVATA